MSPRPPQPPTEMTEVAGILARAALRLRQRTALGAVIAYPDSTCGPENLSESRQDPLDYSTDPSVHGDRVVDAPERARPGGSP